MAFGGFVLHERLLHMPKNPIGIREDGTFVSVAMMTEADRGRKCHVKCPNPKCNCDFQFVLGDEDSRFEPYFRHDGKNPCNASAAFMAGLYGCLADYIRSKTAFVLPPVIVRFPYFGELNDDTIEFCSDVLHDNEIQLYPETKISLDHVDVQYDSEKPICCIASRQGREIVFVMDEIDIGCVQKRKKPDKIRHQKATIFVDVRKILPESIDELNLSEFMNRLDDHQVFQWLYTPRWKDFQEEIEKERDELKNIKKQSRSKDQNHKTEEKSDEGISNEEKTRIILESKAPLILPGLFDHPITWRVCRICGNPISNYSTVDSLEGIDAPYLCECNSCAKNKE